MDYNNIVNLLYNKKYLGGVNMNKKYLVLVLVTTMMVSAIAGCSSKDNTKANGSSTVSSTDITDKKTATKSVTLKMWGGVPPESGPQEVCDNFNKEYADKGIQIEYERFVNDADGNLKLETNLLSGGDIDLYMTYSQNNLDKRATGNLALDLTSLINRDNFKPEDVFGSIASTVQVNGKYYSIPTTRGTASWLINKDMFDAAGIPIPTNWTLDEFREIAKQLTKGEGTDKVYGFYLNDTQCTSQALFPAKAVLGGNLNYKDSNATESNFDNPAFLKSLQTIADMMLVDKTAIPYTDELTQKMTPESAFIGGKAAITTADYSIRSVKDVKTYPHTFKTAFVPIPTPDKGDKYILPAGLGDNLCINPESKNVDAAWEFVKWYATKGMLPMSSGGRIPACKDFNLKDISEKFLAGTEDLIDASSYENVVLRVYPDVEPQTISVKGAEIATVTGEECEAVLTGKTTPKEALENMKTKADGLLKAK